MTSQSRIKIVGGTTGRALVEGMMTSDWLASFLDPADVVVGNFTDQEVRAELAEGQLGNVRHSDLYIVNSICTSLISSGDALLELMFLTDAARRSDPARITLVIPYLGYNRQERKDRPRVPVSAKVIMKMLAQSGADRVLVCDLHAPATLPHFDPLISNEIFASKFIIPYLKQELKTPFRVGSPDTGGTKRASKYAKLLGRTGYITFDKGERPEVGQLSANNLVVIGDVADQDLLLVDDIIDSGKTITQAALAARARGAKDIRVVATHGVLSAGAVERLDACEPIVEVIVTDTIPRPLEFFAGAKRVKITILPSIELFAEAISRLHAGSSISEMIL